MTSRFNPKRKLCFYVMAKQGELSGWMYIISFWVFCGIVPAPAVCTKILFLRAAIVISLDVVGRAMAQAVGRLFFIPDSRVNSRTDLCGVCDGYSDAETCIYQIALVFRRQYYSTSAP
jgi:hypothetical protein